MDNPEGKFPAEFNTYQEVNCGDFVFCLFDVEETPRTVGLSSYDGMITGAYTVFQTNAGFDNKFLYYFYLNLDSTKRLKPLYRGLRNTIPKDSFLSFKTFVPPHEQQTRIANFLDKKTTQIDEAIAIKEQQISLLKERKQIIIQQAVTQGLDPNVPMKDSGVDWIGKIPAHWDAKRLKYLGKSIIGLTYSPNDLSDEKGGTLVARSSNLYEGKFKYGEKENVYVNCFIPEHLKLKKGDILICSRNGSRDLIGKCAFVSDADEGNSFGAFTTVFRSKHNEYLFCILNSDVFKMLSGTFLTSTINQLTVGNLNSIFVPLPPSKNERDGIITYINRLNGDVERAIEYQKIQIERLKEYKATLINSAVTGKIKITPEMLEQ
jgi:type I restriction enzyme S subunit